MTVSRARIDKPIESSSAGRADWLGPEEPWRVHVGATWRIRLKHDKRRRCGLSLILVIENCVCVCVCVCSTLFSALSSRWKQSTVSCSSRFYSSSCLPSSESSSLRSARCLFYSSSSSSSSCGLSTWRCPLSNGRPPCVSILGKRSDGRADWKCQKSPTAVSYSREQRLLGHTLGSHF